MNQARPAYREREGIPLTMVAVNGNEGNPQYVGTDVVVDTLSRFYKIQLELCKQLEIIADDLPDNIDGQSYLYAARMIYPEIKRCHDFEETVFFPAVRKAESEDTPLESILERLRYEHWEDESYAEEVSEALSGYVHEPANRNPETLAYMLRGFFEGLRRHIAFERDHLIPILVNQAAKHS